MHVSMKA